MAFTEPWIRSLKCYENLTQNFCGKCVGFVDNFHPTTMLIAYWGDTEADLRYSSEEDVYFIGRSCCPFPVLLGTHECCFYIEQDNDVIDVSVVTVTQITRRFVYFTLDDDYESSSNSDCDLSASASSGIAGFHESDHLFPDSEPE